MILDIVSEIQNEFQYIDGNGLSTHPRVRFQYGKWRLNQPIQDQQVIWFVENESFSDDVNHVGANGLQVMARQVTISFNIFSKDMNTVEEIINDLIVATKYKVFSPSITSVEGEWIDKGETEQSAFGYRLDITIDTVINKRPLRTVVLTSYEKTIGYEGSLEVITP